MDGFHLAQAELERQGLADRKGAPATFDVGGFVALLQRLRTESEVVYAPAFDRHLEQAIAGSIAITASHSTVVVEGNYLLHDRDGWEQVGPLLDECWFVDVDPALRRSELVARHIAHGRSRPEAEAWVDAVDEPNARLIAATRHRAERVVGRDASGPDDLAPPAG